MKIYTYMQIPSKLQAFIQHRHFALRCYIALFILYLLCFWQDVAAVFTFPDLLVAPIMSLGSFVAGSTFLGGGAVAFPALTKILGTDPHTAKTFSLAIQSVGMSAASLYIISRIPNLPFKFMGVYCIGSALGLCLSLTFIQGVFTAVDIRVGFTLFVLCFLVVYLWTHKNITGHPEALKEHAPYDHEKIVLSMRNIVLTIGCGVVGGLISGLIGSGADLLAFCLLALFFRIEIKLATQISVIVMAASSIMGIALEALVFNNVPSQVVDLWLIAAPVVLFGAPIGAMFCKRTTSSSLIIFICCIVATEVLSTLLLVEIAKERLLFYGMIFCSGLVFLTLLFLQSPYHFQRVDRSA